MTELDEATAIFDRLPSLEDRKAAAGLDRAATLRLFAINNHAVAIGTPLAARRNWEHNMIGDILYLALHGCENGLPVEAVLGWCEVLSLEPPAFERETALAWTHMQRGFGVSWEYIDAGLPGPLGALAWAAGLTSQEAAAQHAAGTLREDTLRTLAALRGWRLTPIGAEQALVPSRGEPGR